MMDSCDCFEPQWPADELLVQCQRLSDILIVVAYFSIPVELVYFVQRSAFFPYRLVLVQFGAFIVLCGLTHLMNILTFSSHSKTVAIITTVAKLSTAIVSCLTALSLVYIIPDLLNVKTRASVLKRRAEDLDREMGLVIKQEETGRHVRMLTHEIRSTLDRHTILNTTLIELGRTLHLEECVLWMPSSKGMILQLSHSLRNLIPFGSTVPISLPVITQVFNSAEAIRIPHNCALARIRTPVGSYIPPEVVAVRVPLLHLSNFDIVNWPDHPAKSYAVMALILPLNGVRKWRDHELELVTVVADQVAVALSHAAILEESMRARDQLMDQNFALNLARQEAEMAIHARNDFLAVMNHEMGTPMHAIIALSSILLETELTPDQRAMIETILKSSNLLAALVNDILDLSRLEDGSLELENDAFNLHGLFREVVRLTNPIASVKKTSMTLNCDLGLPAYGIVWSPEYLQEWQSPNFCPTLTDGLFYLLVQVKDSGSGIKQQDIPHIFTKFSEPRSASNRSSTHAGLGLAICKRVIMVFNYHAHNHGPKKFTEWLGSIQRRFTDLSSPLQVD
ncbi:hypothetical protein L1987_29021 [Smallanthus sonchifolius]|uniref:Uncharacterized protein n=1 Tax=Smallanthus sonchifolius TaxID=185202 RepID=A0ACB9I0B6_9ASTR|nr:hypothetical protein L1987_29021 [Smallanthus sonchifolius]